MHKHGSILALATLLGACSSATDEGSQDSHVESGGAFHLDLRAEQAGAPTTAPMTAATWSAANAYWMGYLSKVAYLDAPQRPAELCKVGLHAAGTPACAAAATDVELLSFDTDAKAGDDHALYVGTAQWGVLAFRGTWSKANWLTDAKVSQDDFWGVEQDVAPELIGTEHDDCSAVDYPGKVHVGFNGAVSRLFKTTAIDKVLRDRHAKPKAGAGRPLYITGHSLGAAMATVTLGRLLFGQYDFTACTVAKDDALKSFDFSGAVPKKLEFDIKNFGNSQAALDSVKPKPLEIVALYTYGSPRSGDPVFARALGNLAAVAHVAHFRFINGRDIVTRVPPRKGRPGSFFFQDFEHVHLTLPGHVEKDADGATFSSLGYLDDKGALHKGDEGSQVYDEEVALNTVTQMMQKAGSMQAVDNHSMDKYLPKLRPLAFGP